MIKTLRILLGLVGLVVVVAFAVANRMPVAVSLAPLPIVLELPVYGVFLLGLVLGGLLGGIALWLGSARYRWRARRLRNQVGALESQMAVLKKREQPGRAAGYAAGSASIAQSAAS
jgi:lipopolysaccharide assembly protein A